MANGTGDAERPDLDAAEHRADFVKRLFPVAIGVGFAGRLALMNWLIGGYSPSGDDLRQLARLLTAMFVIVLSWDWYARDIGRYPLKRILRFLVDVAIIVLYLAFLLSAAHASFWFGSLVLIFFGYVVWDFVRVIEPEGPGAKVYFSPESDRGPLTNLCWLIYFLVIAILLTSFSARGLVVASCMFVLVGVILLRWDGIGGFKIWQRLAMMGILIVLCAIYLALFHVAA